MHIISHSTKHLCLIGKLNFILKLQILERIELSIPDGKSIGDTYVWAPTLSPKQIEDHIERNIVPFFLRLGFNLKKVDKSTGRTPDFEYEDLGLEVTSLQRYLPRNTETDKLLKKHNDTNSRICAYMYMEQGKQKIEILDEQNLEGNISILCLMQHISCYIPKLVETIDDKCTQDQDHDVHIIIMDFRLAQFDSYSLKRVIRSILQDRGMEYPSLGGILVSIPPQIDSDMLGDSDYVFVNNTYCKSQHKILTKLDKFSTTTKSNWIMANQIFVKRPSGQYAHITSPCFDCPGKAEIEMRGLPTF
jgi:hypothetical protein